MPPEPTRMKFVDPEGNDGGDARCLSQLLMLQELTHRLEHDHGRPIRPCEYFHSITGVGAAGVITILLGVLGMTVEDAMKAFAGICEKVFPPGECSEASRSERLILAFQGILDDLHLVHDTPLEGAIDLSAGCHVSTCYSAAFIHGCRMFRNYKSRQLSYNPTIVEAARVSWATPGLFSSVRIGPPLNQEELISVVNGFNNPALEAAREARDVFGNDRTFSTFLSLGSGTRSPISISSGGFLERIIQQTEDVEENIERVLGTSNIYFRLSPHHTVEGDHLTIEEQLGFITPYTRAYLERDRTSRSMDNCIRASAHTSKVYLELKDAARLVEVAKQPELSSGVAPAATSQSSTDDAILLAELRIPGLQCASSMAGCMEGTREDILKRIDDWSTNFSAPNILWLKGHPGVGKSAIAMKVVERLGDLKCLGSSFFQRQNAAALSPQALWRTVAYDLARQYPNVHDIIVAKLKEVGMGSVTSNVELLFRHLIYEPLIGSHAISNAKLPVVIIDALGECGGLDGQHSTHRKALIKTLETWSRLPGTFKLIVTSRSENDINRLFSKTQHYPIEIMAGQTVDARSSEDIRVFLKDRFHKVAIQYPNSLPQDWPGSQIIGRLTHQAAGLFIWAETVVKFIELGQPQQRLKQVLQGENTGDMGTLYEQILSHGFREPTEEDVNEFRCVVGTIILAKEPLSLLSLSQLLAIDACTVEHICNVLQPVLHSKGVLQFHHQSFVDYLVDQSNCPKHFLIDPKREHRKLTLVCLRTMKSDLRFNICGLESSHHRNADIPDLQSRETEYIFPHLSYSCCWWASHLSETKFERDVLSHLHHFMHEQFLWWLEVLSIRKRINQASGMLSSLVEWIPSHSQDEATMAADMQKFAAVFASVISQGIPHIYLSALPFSPPNSAMSKQYLQGYPRTLAIQTGGLNSWPAIQNVLTGHHSPISTVLFSPDGKSIASCSDDKSIRVWDAETGEVVAGPFEGHTGAVNSVAFSPDGTRIISGSADMTIRIWSVETGDMVTGPFEGHNSWIYSVALSPDGKHIASGSADMTIRVWDVETGQTVTDPFKRHTEAVLSVSFSPDGKCVVSGADDATIRVWDVETGGVVSGPFEGHIEAVLSAAFSPDGNRVVSSSGGGTIRVWDAEIDDVIRVPSEGHSNHIYSVSFSPNGKRIVSGSFDNTIRVWDAETGGVVTRPVKGHSREVKSIALSFDEMRIASASSSEAIRVWGAGAETGKALAGPFEGHSHVFTSVAFSPDGRRVVSGSHDETIRMWDAETGKMIVGPFIGHTKEVSSVIFLPDGKRVISGSCDATIRVWDAGTGLMIAGPFQGHTEAISSIGSSPDGGCVVSGSYDKTIRIWDTQTGGLVAGPFEGHNSHIYTVAYSPDGKRVASGSSDNTIRVWNAETGEMVAGPFEGHTNAVNSVAFSPAVNSIVSGSADMTIRIWNAGSGDVVAGPFEGHSHAVTSVAFSPDGTRIVSGSFDKTIRVWNVESGKSDLTPLESHTESLNSVALLLDGKHVVSETDNETTEVRDSLLYDAKNLRQILPSFTDSSTMVDGWIFGSNSEPLFWVPPTLRAGLWWPSNTLVIGNLITTRLNFSLFVHGDAWQLCKMHQGFANRNDVLDAGGQALVASPSVGENSMLARNHEATSFWGSRAAKRKAEGSPDLTEISATRKRARLEGKAAH